MSDVHKGLEPDHIIILDYLIYRTGNKSEQEAWELVKTTLMKLGHGGKVE